MVSLGPTPAASSTAVRSPTGVGFVEWSPIIGGALLAAALSSVLLTFGTAIGLSATSPWPNSGLSPKVLASIAIFYVMAQQIGSLMVGGYVAGRMRTRWAEASQDEAEFRDGLHGALVWALGVVISALLVISAAGSAAQKGAEITGQTVATAVTKTDPMDSITDTMLRSTSASAAQPAPSATTPATARTRVAASGDDTRAEVSRSLAASVASGSISNENRTYLAQIVAQRAGISQEEAQKRVDAAINSAREAADKARRAAILMGFVTAAGLILSLGAAWWAAMKGGNHRDNSIPARFAFDQRRRLTTS